MLPPRHALRTAALVACALLVTACSQGVARRDSAPTAAPAPIEQHSRKVVPATAKPKVKPKPKPPAQRPAPAADLWAELPAMFALDAAGRPEVAREIEWLSNNPRYIEKVSLSAAPYLHFVVSQLRELEMPGELALLPILESGYEASARSPYGAAGLWQFMGGTGDKMGLAMTPWFDGRADVEKSTRAALEYLQVLQKQFGGDWLLAIAAYNMGWGTVERSLATQRRRGAAIDFWALEGTRASRQLVARLLALAAVLRERDRYALRFLPIPNKPYFGRVELARPADLTALPARLGLDPDLFRRLNPGWRRGHTGPLEKAYLLVPLERVAHARTVLAALPESPVPALPAATRRAAKGAVPTTLGAAGAGSAVHRVAAGDSLWTIARRHETSVDKLLAANPGVTRKTVLALGQSLRLPQSARTATKAPGSAANRQTAASAGLGAPKSGATTPPAAGGKATHYKVRQGDSLWTIARQFKVSIEDLLAWNKLKRDARLNLGQDLIVSPAG